MAVKYIYSNQVANKLPGSNQNYYFRTVTEYDVDSNGKPTGEARTMLFYAPGAGARGPGGSTWTNGTADSLSNFDKAGWVAAAATDNGGKSFQFLRYTQRDVDNGIISADKLGTPVLGATARQSLTTPGGIFYETIQNTLINTAVKTQPGLAQVVSAKQANTATPPPQTQPGSGAATETKISLDDLTLEQIYGDKEATRKWKGEIYKYPTSIDSNKQDYIKFNVVSYVASKPNNKDALLLTKDTTKKEIKATIILPIQPSITDLNSVDWNGLGLNPVDLALYGISSGAVNGSPEQVQSVLSQLGTSITKDPNVQKAITLYLKQKAVGVEGLLSRFSGAIVNPNLELLFQGVQLRPFNFTFRLSPRDDDEAKQVKNIIRAFKEAMTPQVASGGLFLATPYVFDIKYVTPGKENHPSLNRIKTCALQSCSVDYTPDGSYMTFNDNEKTMTSYNLTLQFQELEPITSKDYTDIKNTAEIGY